MEENASTPPITLSERKCRIMADVQTIKNDGMNKHHGFKYASNAEVMEHIRQLMAKHGVALSMTTKELDRSDGERWMMVIEFELKDSVTGERETSNWYQDVFPYIKAGVKDDKALGKSYTYAEKYFLMKTFLVGSADDVDLDQDAGRNDHWGAQARERIATMLKAFGLTWETVNSQIEPGRTLHKLVDTKLNESQFITRLGEIARESVAVQGNETTASEEPAGDSNAEDIPFPQKVDDALQEAYEVKRVEFMRHAGKRRRDVLYRVTLDGAKSLGLESVFAYSEHIEAFMAAGYKYETIHKDENIKPLVMLRQDAAGYRIVAVQHSESSEWIEVKGKHAVEQVRVEIIKLVPGTINGDTFYTAHLHGGKTFDIFPVAPRSKRADQVKLLRDAGYGAWLDTTKDSDWTEHPIQALVDPRGDNWKLIKVEPREDDERPAGEQSAAIDENAHVGDVFKSADGKADFAKYLSMLNVKDDSKYLKPLNLERWGDFSGKYGDLKREMAKIKAGPKNQEEFVAAVKRNTYDDIKPTDIERYAGMSMKKINEAQSYAHALEKVIAMFEAEMTAEKARTKSSAKQGNPNPGIVIQSIHRRSKNLNILIPTNPVGKEIRLYSRNPIRALGPSFTAWIEATQIGEKHDVPEDLGTLLVDEYEENDRQIVVKSFKIGDEVPF